MERGKLDQAAYFFFIPFPCFTKIKVALDMNTWTEDYCELT